MQRFFWALIVGMFSILLAACGGNSPDPAASGGTIATSQAASAEKIAETGPGSPVTLENCGLEITVATPPERVVAMNQSATEILLTLGLQDRLVGTAYLDDEILPEYQAAYQQIPVLAEQYPSQEVLFGAEPDFIYGGFASAFGDEAAGPREKLIKLGLTPYLSPAHCEDETLRPEVASMNDVYREIREIGQIFGIDDRAETLITDMETRLTTIQTTIDNSEPGPTILWYDSGDDEPFVGAGTGVPNMIIELAGAENIFKDLPGAWETVSWEEIVARDAGAIVVIEADWSTAQEKIELLTNSEVYGSLTAVQEKRFIVIPFSYTTAGVRNAAAVELLARGLYPDLFSE